MVYEYTDGNFKKEVQENSRLVLVDFWAPWCGPCRIQGPIMEQLSDEFKGNAGVVIGKMNVDENPETAQTHGIMSIPTIKVFQKGQVIDEMIGLQQKETIKRKINEHLAA